MERMLPRESAAAVPVDWRSQLLGSTSTTVGKATRQQGRASRGRCHVHFTGCVCVWFEPWGMGSARRHVGAVYVHGEDLKN